MKDDLAGLVGNREQRPTFRTSPNEKISASWQAGCQLAANEAKHTTGRQRPAQDMPWQRLISSSAAQ